MATNRRGKVRFFDVQTWATTPLQDVGTDTREYDVLTWQVQTGVLQGAKIPFITDPLKETDLAFNVLATSVLGSIIQSYVPIAATSQETQAQKLEQFQLPHSMQDLKGAFHLPVQPSPSGNLNVKTTQYVYEARVLEGFWGPHLTCTMARFRR